MKAEKTGKKTRKRNIVENEDGKASVKGTKAKKSNKMKKRLDWRDLLMEDEEEDYFLPNH